MPRLFESKVGKEFADRVDQIAKKTGISYDELMIMMCWESAGTFSPSIRNKYTNATGLIQFMPSTAAGLGTSISQLSLMTAVKQLDYVEKYLLGAIKSVGKPAGYLGAYFLVFYPAAVLQKDSWLFPSSVAKANPAFDVNKTGVFSKRDVQDTLIAFAKSKGAEVSTLSVQKKKLVDNMKRLFGMG